MKKSTMGFLFNIFGLILNILTTIGLIISVINFKIMVKEPSHLNELEKIFQNDPSLNNSDINQLMNIIKEIMMFSNSYGWLIILLFILSIILNTIYLLNINKKNNSNTSLKFIFLSIIFSLIFLPGALCLIISIIITYFHKRKFLKNNTHNTYN